MIPAVTKTLNNAILKLLRPLVHMLLRNGISYHVFADLARWVYVDVAFKDFGIPGRAQTTSRVSVITGLSRKEVQKLRDLAIPVDRDVPERYNRASRVISGWVRDPLFLDGNNAPRDLPLDGDGSFGSLVRKYSGDMPVRAVLDELINVGTVQFHQDGTVRLLARAYVPGRDMAAKIEILGTDTAHLLATVNHNLNPKSSSPFFQRKVSYDNVPVEFLEEFKGLSSRESQSLLERLDTWLAEHDRDVNAGIPGSGRKRVGVGIYYFEEDTDSGITQTAQGDDE